MNFEPQKLEAYFRSLEQQDRFSGVALITQADAEVFSGAYGFASRAWKAPNTLDTRFDTASLTKLFTAVAVLQLIDQGKLAFHTPVIEFLGLADSAISSKVNIYHLLTHSSGIGDDCDEEAGEIYEDLWKTRTNYLVTETVHFLPQFIFKPANFSPGQGCRYCNCSFILLGLVIEKISGVSYREYIQDRVFSPGGMTSSGFFRLDRVVEQVAEGCDPLRNEEGVILGWKKNIYSFPPIGSPDSGAYVTARDLDRFLRAVQAGRLFSPEWVRTLTTPQVFYRDSKMGRWMFSYVLEFLVDPVGNTVFYQKDGVNAGVNAIMRYYPQSDINVILLSNMEGGILEPIWKIHEMIL
jgi:CubicO group peptidase (beta-lactamase class C family)